MKVSVKNETVICTSVFFLRHGVIDNLVNLRSAVKNVQEGPDDVLVAGNIGFGLNVSGGLFDDIIDGSSKVRKWLW